MRFARVICPAMTGHPPSESTPVTENSAARRRSERRNLVSSIFIVMLVGIAYQEMASAVRDSMRDEGRLSFGTAVLMIVFFATSMRFLIGNQLHLLGEQQATARGEIWFFDFLMTVLESVALVFLGGLTSVAVNRTVPVDFIEVLLVLCLLDVAWVLSQWVFGGVIPALKRSRVPWPWALLNGGVALLTAGILWTASDPFDTTPMTILLVVNLAAFVIDVVLVDHYDLL